MYKFSIVTCARWETNYISEWIAYYDLLGFDHIYLTCNDDDPNELAAQVHQTKMSRPDFVSFVHFQGQGQQRAMYLAAMHRARLESEWVTFLDIDEFLVLRGYDSIRSFMQRWDAVADSIHFNWLFFGNNGFVNRPPGSVLRQYTRRSSHLSTNTKHVTRSSCLSNARLQAAAFPFWHALPDPEWSGVRRYNILGAPMAPLLADYPHAALRELANTATEQAIIRTAVVNHYAIKSEEDFVFRVQRGVGGDFAGQTMWREQLENGSYRATLDSMDEVEDTYLRDLSVARLPEIHVAEELQASTLQRIRVKHQLWVDDLLLSNNGRLRHASHGSMASYRLNGDALHVKWDNYPEDLFLRRGEVFVHSDMADVL